MKKELILCVDDEPAILTSLKLLFEDAFEVIVTGSPREALDILKHNTQIRVIISDHRMPEMTGLDFFKEIRNTMPEIKTYNILYSGFTELENEMERMIEERILNEFLTKTCPTRILISSVINGFKYIRKEISSLGVA